MRPPPPRTADEWADDNRILPAGSAEPGPWRSSRTPYLIPILRAAADFRFRRVIMVMGSQLGKTEALLNLIGWRLDDDPVPILYVSPTQRQAESISRDRLGKMLKSTPSLYEKLSRGQMDKISEKWISGVRLGFAWAGSATELASHPAGMVLVDERDRMDESTGGEGDPVSLAEARVATFPDGKVVVCSTPTLEGASPIWALWEEGTQHRWAWPCPHCDEHFVPTLELLRWPEDCTPHRALKEARLACPECGSEIEDRHRPAMNARGLFLAPGQRVENGEVVGDMPESDTCSFWVSGLCSPWRTWGQRAKAFIEASRSKTPGRVQAVINTQFGELYKLQGEAPDWTRVAELRGGYESGTVPEGVRVLTAGVDVQGNRLVYAIRGWGVNSESWLIEASELWGETAHEAVWRDLGALLAKTWGSMTIRRTFIDSGYNPSGPRTDNLIYAFCRQHRGRAFPAKGHDTLHKPLKAAQIDVSQRGRIIKNGVQLWHLDSDYFKSWVHGRIEWPVGESGAFHLPADTTDDYCQQLVAEQRLVRSTGRVSWIRTRKDNHFLDCEALAAAAAHSIAVHTMQPAAEGEAAPAPPPRRGIPSDQWKGRQWTQRRRLIR
jgi:phage terminase large subunit GpA-like protein